MLPVRNTTSFVYYNIFT